MKTKWKEQIANDLLAIQAVELRPNDPFTWASGLRSPIYCDNRLSLGYPLVRKHIADGLAYLVERYYPEASCIAGTATAGIPHAALVADRLGLPMVYIRSKAKDHGRKNQVEGFFQAGSKMVVIDDLISTGGSVLEAVAAAEREGAEVCGVLSIFTYELAASEENFAKANKEVHSLTNYSTLIACAQKKKVITEEEVQLLKHWRESPETAYKK